MVGKLSFPYGKLGRILVQLRVARIDSIVFLMDEVWCSWGCLFFFQNILRWLMREIMCMNAAYHVMVQQILFLFLRIYIATRKDKSIIIDHPPTLQWNAPQFFHWRMKRNQLSWDGRCRISLLFETWMSLMIGRVAEIVISHQWRTLATSAPLRSLH